MQVDGDGQKQRRIKTVKGEITITPAYGYVRVSGVGQGDSERDGIARQKDTVRKYRCANDMGGHCTRKVRRNRWNIALTFSWTLQDSVIQINANG